MAQLKDEIRFLDEKLKKIQDEKPMARAVLSVHAEQVVRVFQKGMNSQGGRIGRYDTRSPLYVNPNTAPKSFPKRGKSGKSKFKNGSAHKTGYFPSYSAFRRAIGRESGKVNLRLSNDLQSDFANSGLVNRAANKVAQPKLSKRGEFTYVIGLSRPVNVQKREALEAKYGRIFYLTAKEETMFHQLMEKEYA